MSFRHRDIEYYDNLPPWLRALIRESELPISAINVGERLKKLGAMGTKFEIEAAKSIILHEENAMRHRIKMRLLRSERKK